MHGLLRHNHEERPNFAEIFSGNAWKIELNELEYFDIDEMSILKYNCDNFIIKYILQKILSLNHLKYLNTIGHGGFGKVAKYFNVLDKQYYAIKMIDIPSEKGNFSIHRLITLKIHCR